MLRPLRQTLCMIGLIFVSTQSALAKERVVELPTRPGQVVRMLAISPTLGPPSQRLGLPKTTAAAPRGTIILIPGGHGNLALTADGDIGWGGDNQLVRTRSAYAAAGFITLLPDIAPDLKDGASGKAGYRWSTPHAEDLGKIIAYARGLAEPVIVVGTSRAALSVTKAAVYNQRLPMRPDALVITSGMLMKIDPAQPAANTEVGGTGKMAQPILLLNHAIDGCVLTTAQSAKDYKSLLTNSSLVTARVFTGGSKGATGADPCGSQSHHGFLDQDAEVVLAITRWINGLPRKPRAPTPILPR
jgi:hypothetical protein